MITRFNRDYKQEILEIEQEFDNCKYLIRMEDIHDTNGYLIAISDSGDTTKEMCDIMDEFSDDTIFNIGGFYEDSMSVGIINFCEEETL